MAANRPLAAGTAFFLLAAAADAALTLHGTGGDPGLEGNPLLRAAMARWGAGMGLLAGKGAAGAACWLVARYGEGEIRRRAAWLERVPMTPWARAWLASGDRSWIAFLPLYGVALAQAAGALSWAVLLARP